MADDEKLTEAFDEASSELEAQEAVAEDVVEAAEHAAADVVEQAAEDAEAVEQAVADAAEEVVEDADAAEQVIGNAETAEAVDEMVEAAVQHVAEEAEADAEAAAEAVAENVEVVPEMAEAEAPKKRERRSKQARAEKAAKVSENDEVVAPKASVMDKLAALGVPAWIGISVACLALGLLLGRFVLGGGAGGTANFTGQTAVSESELDNVYATYTFRGKSGSVTVREVIEQNGTLDASLTEDGTYTIPSAENAINAVRTAILNSEVEARGIEVSDEDVAAYAEEALGTSDYEAIASTYGMDVDAVKKLITQNCRLNTLRDEIVGDETAVMPDAPTEAAEGKEDEATKEYAEYIIALAGDEWDAEKGTWASEDGTYATALAEYEVTADGASYNAAQAAYYMAYQLYTEKSTEISNRWNDFLNDLMSNATIKMGTLML